MNVCHAKALHKDDEGLISSINQNLCVGCNLCVENCPNNVFESHPRKIYYDASIGKKKTLEA
jgi:Fe-S-cluster-containing dehydrogenase component